MKDFFGKGKEKLLEIMNLDFDRLMLHVVPRFLLEIASKYLRLEVEGIGNVPKRGRAIVLPNHSGWSGFDAVMIGNEIHKHTGRVPRILAHRAWFLGDIKIVAEKMGLKEASTGNGLKLLRKNNLIVLFPEGEHGNFKPTSERYRLQEFKRGFVRLALTTGAPIVPTIVIGAEETHINLATLKFSRYLREQVIPIPLNILPLPAKWKIKFLEPLRLDGYSAKDAEDNELVRKIANEVQNKMQAAIDEELKNRKWIYFSPSE